MPDPDKPGPEELYNLEPPESPSPGKPPKTAGGGGKGKIEAESVLAGFEEDADFTADPEVERVAAGKPEQPVRVVADPPELIKPGLGGARVWGVVGAVLAVGALVATGVNAGDHHVARILLALYSVALHAGTGVVAVYVAAVLTERRVTRVELVAARMLTAVAAFSLVFHLRIDPFGESFKTGKLEETLLGAAVYLGVVAGLFRFQRFPFLYVVGSHFGLWLVVQLGMELSRFVAGGAKPG
jgi:hypothetical protein